MLLELLKWLLIIMGCTVALLIFIVVAATVATTAVMAQVRRLSEDESKNQKENGGQK